MADLDRRELERRTSTGDLAAAARLLVERVRAGELPERHLELAAALGDEAACAARGAWESLSYDAWCSRVAPLLAGEGAVRAALALLAVGVRFPGCARGMAGLEERELEARVAAVERYLVDPRGSVRRELRNFVQRSHHDCALRSNAKPGRVLMWLAWLAAGWAIDETGHEPSLPWASLLTLDEPAGIQDAIAADLVPWLLGHRDPVRERVASRADP